MLTVRRVRTADASGPRIGPSTAFYVYTFCRSLLRRYQFLFKKGPIFIKKHNKGDMYTKLNNCIFSRDRFARVFWGVISAFINLNIDLRRPKTRKSNKQTHQSYNVCKNGCSWLAKTEQAFEKKIFIKTLSFNLLFT